MADGKGKDEGGKLLYCSFCGKNQNEVRKLIAGPSVYICDECVDLCNDIIREEVLEADAEPTLTESDADREVDQQGRQPGAVGQAHRGDRECAGDARQRAQRGAADAQRGPPAAVGRPARSASTATT